MCYFMKQYVKRQVEMFAFNGCFRVMLATTLVLFHVEICILVADGHIEQF
jgi:hypothetical protein